MEHDRIAEGGNVIKVATALHDLTPHNLAAAADAWRARFAPLPRPLVGVAVGGDLNGRTFSEHDSARLVDGLVRLRSAGMGLAITPSRRTPRRTLQRLQEAFAGDAGVYLWDGSGENPYRAILGLADRFVVTSDSVSMVSEALSIGRPVEILDLDFARHRGFVQDLVDQRLARRFCGDPSTPDTRGPANATLQAAAAVRKLLQARTGVSG
jgi:mitochondrial fission protein ELM1